MPPDRYRGYIPLRGDNAAASLDDDSLSLPDLKESFSIGPFDMHPTMPITGHRPPARSSRPTCGLRARRHGASSGKSITGTWSGSRPPS